MGVWNARLLDDSLHKALYGRGKALYQSTHHYKDFGLLGSHADPTGVGLAGLQLRLGHLPRRCLLWWLRSADGALPVADFAPSSAILDRWATNASSLLRKASVGWFLWLHSAEGSMLRTGRSNQ